MMERGRKRRVEIINTLETHFFFSFRKRTMTWSQRSHQPLLRYYTEWRFRALRETCFESSILWDRNRSPHDHLLPFSHSGLIFFHPNVTVVHAADVSLFILQFFTSLSIFIITYIASWASTLDSNIDDVSGGKSSSVVHWFMIDRHCSVR